MQLGCRPAKNEMKYGAKSYPAKRAWAILFRLRSELLRRTISAMSGPGVVAHNRRTYTAANVDKERSKDNIEYCYTDIKQVYHELFDDALS